MNFFKIDTTYAHSYEDTETFGVYGSITEDTVPNKYLNILPLDPRTSSYYSYGKTKGTAKIVANQFEIASVQILEGVAIAKVSGNYTAEAGPYNLIREYNGSNFVTNNSKTNLPYNPEELIMIVTDGNGTIYREGDTISANESDLELFFSDGSVSILTKDSQITLNSLDFPKGDNLNTIVKLALGAGTIWTKATHLNDESKFEVYTTDSTAAVRGTIFGVTKNTNTTETIVIEGVVNVYEAPVINENENILDEKIELNIEDYDVIEKIEIIVEKNEAIKTITTEENIEIFTNDGVPSITPREIIEDDKLEEIEIIIDSYTPAETVRDEETVAMIKEEIQIAAIEANELKDTEIIDDTGNCQSDYHLEGSSCAYNYIEDTGYDATGKKWKKRWNGYEYLNDEVLECSIGDLIGGEYEASVGECEVTEEDIIPGSEKTVNLSGAFDIEIVVDSVPTTKQYLLYGGDDFKLFFGNGDNEGDICFDSDISNDDPFCKPVVNKKITISRYSSGNISLYGYSTGRNVSSTIGEFKIGYFPLGATHILEMSSSNKIELKIIK